MLVFHSPLPRSASADCRVRLTFFQRQKARFKASLDDGSTAGFQLKRGQVLRCGDKLLSDGGQIVEIISADEMVSTVVAPQETGLARVCYHLGNRHVSLQIGDGWCRYLHDHVLDDMVKNLGFTVSVEHAPFDPEPGAYAAGSTHQHHHHHHE